MDYQDECQQRKLKIWADRANQFDKVSEDLQIHIKNVLKTASNEAADLAKEVREWEVWALVLLYGQEYWKNPKYGIGLNSDMRSWIAKRVASQSNAATERILELEKEVLRLKNILEINGIS